jgi:hypothetical protein
MHCQQAALQYAVNNVELVRLMGVKLVTGRIPAAVRKELREGVKTGSIGHLKKDGLMPEAFFHPNSKVRAIDERRAVAFAAIQSIQKICI